MSRYAIVVARYYEQLADRLITGAKAALAEAAAEQVDVYEVPGAFELPAAAKYCAESGRYDGVVCLGAVIRGETDHYDFVCNEAARGIQQGAGESALLLEDNAAATAWLAENLREGDAVLLKASRGARLDEVAATLQ